MIADVSSTVADNAMIMLAPDAPPLRKVALRAGKHDSVASVAQRYRVSAAQVAQWNDVGTGAKFAPGRPSSSTSPNKARKARCDASTRSAREPAHRPHVARAAARSGSKPSKATRDGRAQARRRQELRPRTRQGARAAMRSAAIDEGVGDGAEVDVLELAADRHAARQPRDADAARASAPRRAHARWLRPRR